MVVYVKKPDKEFYTFSVQSGDRLKWYRCPKPAVVEGEEARKPSDVIRDYLLHFEEYSVRDIASAYFITHSTWHKNRELPVPRRIKCDERTVTEDVARSDLGGPR